MDIEVGLLSKIVSKEDILLVLEEQIDSTFFEKYRAVYEFVRSHFAEYGVVPELSILEDTFAFKPIITEQPIQYFIDALKQRKQLNLYKAGLEKIVPLVGKGKVDEAERQLQRLIIDTRKVIKSSSDIDVRTGIDERLALYTHRQECVGIDGYSSPWDYLNAKTLGYHPGDLFVTIAVPKMGKGIRVDEKLPTPTGYKCAADIQVGDYLFGVDGKPTKVTFVSDVHNLPCYKVYFNDHSSLVTDYEHRWTVYERVSHGRLTTPTVLSTENMYRSGTKTKDGRNRFAIPLAEPLEYAPKELPVHPYILGLWLGDGTAREACITVGKLDKDAIIQQITQFGISVTVKTSNNGAFTIRFSDGNRKKPKNSSVQSALRELNLLNNKHIPQIYLYASIQQRVDLLRGLMDSDGSSADKSPRFYNSSLTICKTVLELVHSLGGRGYIASKITYLKGKKYTTYQVVFQVPFSCFYLARKQQKERLLRRPYRYITHIEPVQSSPTICFQVEAKDSLYVASSACIVTHNTWLLVHQAHHIWKEERVPVVFVTKEMTPQAIRQRFDALECRLSYDALRRGMLSPYHEEMYQAKLAEIAEDSVPFIILGYSLESDTSTVSSLIPKVERYLSDGGVLFVDGLYLMDDDRGDEDWKRVVNIARDLKLLALQYKIPVVATTQAQIQENKSYVPDISNIAYGKYIAQYVDALLSQSQNPQQKIAEIMYINILAQREGDVGSFPINFCFDPLDFSQKEVTILDYNEEEEESLL